MKPDTQLLKAVWENSSQHISRKNVELDQFHLDELVSSLFSSGPFYFYVIDFVDMQLKYVSPSIRDIHGLNPETVIFQDILDQIHPDDMHFVSRAEAQVMELFYQQIPAERRKKYKVSYCFRFRTTDGSYQLFNHQAVILSMDEQGRLAQALNIHTNINHLTSKNSHKVSAIGLFGEASFLNLDPLGDAATPAASSDLFTRRERQIVQLLSQGLTSTEIADRLSIAANTVKNHRKNILQKANCRNVSQLITRCITEGLV